MLDRRLTIEVGEAKSGGSCAARLLTIPCCEAANMPPQPPPLATDAFLTTLLPPLLMAEFIEVLIFSLWSLCLFLECLLLTVI